MFGIIDKNTTEVVNLIKNVVDILFLLITGILALLTYLKARKTILQPLKAETAKKQFELLSEMYKDLNKHPTLSMSFYYQDIVFLNVIKTLDYYGLIKIKEPFDKILKEECVGGILFPNINGKIETMEKVMTFSNKKELNKPSQEQTRKKLRETAFKGRIYIETMAYPKKTHEFLLNLDSYAKNPFLPKKIAFQLDVLRREFSENLKIMKNTIEIFVKRFAKRVKNKEDTNFTIDGIYNEFNGKSLKHQRTVDTLLAEIRNHLCIDEGW